MKKLFSLILVLGFMLGGVASAEKVNFICKNINNREQDFCEIIDFKGETLTKNGTKYKIN